MPRSCSARLRRMARAGMLDERTHQAKAEGGVVWLPVLAWKSLIIFTALAGLW